MTHTRKEENTESDDPTTALSAQIMDLPYEAYKDSLSSHKPINSVNTNKITKPDILAKLKEIYKACSCKICECIPGYSATYDVSKVNTCGCEDTEHKHIHNTEHGSQNSQHDCIQLPHLGCACYRCDRKDCRGVCKNKMETATCDCEPCQCVECTTLNSHVPRPVIVAPMQGNFQQSLCQCEPCECIHCTHNYGTMASNLMRQTSTDMASHRNCNCDTCANNSCQSDGNCRCDTQNRIVRKPIDRSMRGYDLHPTSLKENSFSRKRSVKIKNCDTIAMYAFLNNSYSNTGFNKSRDNCHCMDCECIICKDNEKYESIVKSSYEGIPLAFFNLPAKSFTTCKCQSCECQLCCKDVEAESDKKLATRAANNCGCDICECLSCKWLPYCSQNKEINDNSKTSFKNKLVDNPAETLTDFGDNISTDYFYPLKKGKLLTPSMFEAKILSNRQFRSQSSLPNVKKLLTSKSILKVNSIKSNKNLACPPNIKICNFKSVNNNFEIVCKQPSNKKLLSAYVDISNNDIMPTHCDNTIEHNTVRCNTNAKKYVNNIEASSSFIFPKKSSAICVVNTINDMNNYNQRNMKVINNEVKLLNSILSTSKGKRNSDVDIFCSRILSFEKSILQIQEDISQSRKALAEICSKNGMSHDNFSEDHAATNFYDIITGKSLLSIHETNLIDPPQYNENYSENYKTGEIVNNTKTLLDSINNNFNLKYDQNDNFSKGDNKLYTKVIKESQVNVSKLRRNVVRSRVKKLSRNSENKIIDFINDHVKEIYRHHGKNILNRKYSTKSAGTSHDNFLVAEKQKLKFKEKNEYSQTVCTEALLFLLFYSKYISSFINSKCRLMKRFQFKTYF
ncbi:uncharacterized protein [Maniola hyperantus]|uniref:uncharacterized protein n=1 Tax=Aphantopus hyperantus TaxID=2795564 RepID=UPI00374836CD